MRIRIAFEFEFCYRERPASAPSASKACKEKIRRGQLNDRHHLISLFLKNMFACKGQCDFSFSFMELVCILEPGRPPKADKAVILKDANRLVTHLRDETKKLKETSENLQHKLTELKVHYIHCSHKYDGFVTYRRLVSVVCFLIIWVTCVG